MERAFAALWGNWTQKVLQCIRMRPRPLYWPRPPLVMCSLKMSVSSTEATASYTKQAVFWAQYGGTRDHVAAFNGAVAVLKACWMHDWKVSGEVVIS